MDYGNHIGSHVQPAPSRGERRGGGRLHCHHQGAARHQSPATSRRCPPAGRRREEATYEYILILHTSAALTPLTWRMDVCAIINKADFKE